MNIKEKVVFVGLDASKATLAVSVADDSRNGEIRDWGTISTTPVSVEKFLKKLAARFDRVEICYEAGTRQRGARSTPQTTADPGVSSATWADLPSSEKLDDALSALVAATIL